MNIDAYELEHKVHQWISRLSVAAMHQKWAPGHGNIQKYGLSNTNKVKLGAYICGSLLDESGDVPLVTRMSVWEHVFEQFAAYVTKNDYPSSCYVQEEKQKVFNLEKAWGCLCQWYVQELDVRNQINSHFATRLESDRKLGRNKM